MGELLWARASVLVLAAALTAGSAAAAGQGTDSCRAQVDALRHRIDGPDAKQQSDHELLGGLTAGQAGAPRENWFGSPPQVKRLLRRLDEAEELADNGDGAACWQTVEQVREALLEAGPPGYAPGDG